MNTILFDANSTSPISAIIAVAPGDCVLINSWGLGANEVAQVYRVLVGLGNIPEQQSGSCVPSVVVQGANIIAETPFQPCNVPVEVGQSPDMNLTSILIQQPGYYRVHLTPAALGVATVEAVVLTGAEACHQAGQQCCCLPETFWEGTSLNPCLVITPGGDAGHRPTFDLNACCLLHAFPALPNPVDTDELIVLSGGQCFRSTIAQVFDPAIICTTLQSFLLQPPAVLDTVVVVDGGGNCIRRDGETFVEFFETPWTGISTTPALDIAPGGINGHGPTFSYDLCADIQAQPSCACEPDPGDQVLIVQAGACVLAQWPVVSACDQMGVLPMGALIAGDTVLVRETGGACKQVEVDTLLTCAAVANLFAPGVSGVNDTFLMHDPTGPTCFTLTYADVGAAITPFLAYPLLAPNGSCAAPTYSFAASPDSGMFYDPSGVGSVVIGDDNCADFIAIGASIQIFSNASNIALFAGTNISLLAVGGFASVQGTTVTVISTGGTTMNTGGGLTVNALGAGNDIAFNANDNIALSTGGSARLTITALGEWNVGGSVGAATQVLTSNGPGVPPTWQAAGGGGVAEPITQVVWGTGPGVDSDTFFLYDNTIGRMHVGLTAGGTPWSIAGNAQAIQLRGMTSTGGGPGGVNIEGGFSQGDFNNAAGVEVRGGRADGVGRSGGSVLIKGGPANNAAPGRGGSLTIESGNTAGNDPGDIVIRLGTHAVSPPSNIAAVAIGGSGSHTPGGQIHLPIRTSQGISFGGVTGSAGVPQGQAIAISGGDAFGGSGSFGGDLSFIPGRADGAGARGQGRFSYYNGGVDVRVGAWSGFGDFVWGGYGDGTVGGSGAALPAASPTGFMWAPRIAAAPTGVPTGANINLATTTSNPMVVRETGGTIVLSIYEFGTATWRNVTLT